MAKRPPQIRLVKARPVRRAWERRPDTPTRLSGRRLQVRNKRIKERDLFTCQNMRCGKLTIHGQVDHKIPISLGGPDDDDGNLQYLCVECNQLKGLAESRGVLLDDPSSFDRAQVLDLIRNRVGG